MTNSANEFDRISAAFTQALQSMPHLHKNTLKFLADLRDNNNREWFDANKPEFLDAKADFEGLVSKIIFDITEFDSDIGGLEARKCIFRIYRDTRFSKDKTPFKTNLGAHMLAGGRKGERNRAGYYIHISPGDCFLAGGAHQPPGSWIDAIRGEIECNAGDLRKIVKAKTFQTYFGEIEGETLKSAPRGYSKDHPEIDLLRRKSFLAVHRIADKTATSAGFLAHAATVFKALHPFGQFLNRGSS